MNDCAGLEIRYALMGIGGLNPSPSALNNLPAPQNGAGLIKKQFDYQEVKVFSCSYKTLHLLLGNHIQFTETMHISYTNL